MSTDRPPPSSAFIRPPPPPAKLRLYETALSVVEHFGQIGRMTGASFIAMWRRPLEIQSTLYQMESLGVRSVGIASVTSIFVGMVIPIFTIQDYIK